MGYEPSIGAFKTAVKSDEPVYFGNNSDGFDLTIEFNAKLYNGYYKDNSPIQPESVRVYYVIKF